MLLAAIGSMLLQFFIGMRSACMTPTARYNAYNSATLNVLLLSFTLGMRVRMEGTGEKIVVPNDGMACSVPDVGLKRGKLPVHRC